MLEFTAHQLTEVEIARYDAQGFALSPLLAGASLLEVLTGRPRIGKLLRGASRFRVVTECPETVCQPDATAKYGLPPQAAGGRRD